MSTLDLFYNRSILTESMLDKGTFKCIFMCGSPGAGKTYTAEQITGGVRPTILNIDYLLERFATAKNWDISSRESYSPHLPKLRELFNVKLLNCVNGGLPLLIDGTGVDIGRTVNRINLMKTLGYDVGMVWVYSDYETIIKRLEERQKKIGRGIDQEFVDIAYKKSFCSREFFQLMYEKGELLYWAEIDNGLGRLTDSVVNNAYRAVSRFYNQIIHNPIGREWVTDLEAIGKSYLVPDIMTGDELKQIVVDFYKHNKNALPSEYQGMVIEAERRCIAKYGEFQGIK